MDNTNFIVEHREPKDKNSYAVVYTYPSGLATLWSEQLNEVEAIWLRNLLTLAYERGVREGVDAERIASDKINEGANK